MRKHEQKDSCSCPLEQRLDKELSYSYSTHFIYIIFDSFDLYHFVSLSLSFLARPPSFPSSPSLSSNKYG